MFVHQTLEIDSGQKSKKIGFLSKVSTTIFKDCMRFPRFSNIHAEGDYRALRKDTLGGLALLCLQ